MRAPEKKAPRCSPCTRWRRANRWRHRRHSGPRSFRRPTSGERLWVPAAIGEIVSDHVLSRREALALIGASSAALLTLALPARAAAPPSCIARPQQTEGPFFVEEELD